MNDIMALGNYIQLLISMIKYWQDIHAFVMCSPKKGQNVSRYQSTSKGYPQRSRRFWGHPSSWCICLPLSPLLLITNPSPIPSPLRPPSIECKQKTLLIWIQLFEFLSKKTSSTQCAPLWQFELPRWRKKNSNIFFCNCNEIIEMGWWWEYVL